MSEQPYIKPITISIPTGRKRNLVSSKKSGPIKLDGQIEVKTDCLKYFHGSWIKCIHKVTKEYNPGGFLTKIEYNAVFLRRIHSADLLELNSLDYIFFVKQDNEQYIAMQKIELEKEKNQLDSRVLKCKFKKAAEQEKKCHTLRSQFEKERKQFEYVKNKFYKLFQDGKAKILI
jgi:hypothetical protein